ncbi:hypothetical protein [uncultured Thiothrix sp.]|uniref:hypothetical protein n=1 Tax=uncultured Thiothrix sp. TaxID=223185 RepID=UPI0026049FF3|nr:hypothetical protein [uncultured Thiothrix sp.]HMT92416.1 hypothetical protein [Thiolinea sp.]
MDLIIFDAGSTSTKVVVSTLTSSLNKKNLLLKAHIPAGMELTTQAIEWRIHDRKGVPVRQLQGQEQVVQLDQGDYQVQLSIGQFTATKLLTVKADTRTKSYFKANIGRLVITANHLADWSITNVSYPDISFNFKASQQVDTWVPNGFYEITLTQSGVKRRQVVNVLAGEINVLNMDIPLVEVNLIAVENKQPLFRPVEWLVFRLERGERHYVGSYHQHSQGITIPVGYYEVVATHASRVRSRQFWVKENTSNRVVLAMD